MNGESEGQPADGSLSLDPPEETKEPIMAYHDSSARTRAENSPEERNSGVTSASFPTEDGSLMHLYESRLRRLRDYESAVFSPFNSHKIKIEPSSVRQPTVEKAFSSSQMEVPFASSPRVAPLVSSSDLPSVINLENDSGDWEMDDITLSTGVVSNIETSSHLDMEQATHQESVLAHSPEDTLNIGVESTAVVEGQDQLEDGLNLSVVHTICSSSSDKLKTGNRHESQNESGFFSHDAASDSKFETYAVLVDTEEDDRAVEIALYSASRPHMRGFHFAWMGFFVAFFTWFALTPLLSEVAVSLTLSREEIWNSSVLAVAGSAVTRVLIGPINDIYGARWTMCATLLFIAIPTGIAGIAIQNAASLYVIRLFIGVAGSAFVTCQFWSSTMFVSEVAGTANSLAAGWGNLGGGVAQLVMGSIIFPLFKIMYGGEGYGNANRGYIADDDEEVPDYDRASDLAWRTAMLIPALMCLYMAYLCMRYSDDSPKGNFRERKSTGLMQVESAKGAILRSCCKWNTWLLFVQYGCCFGVEITMTNAAALYFKEEFEQSTESAAAIASVFGWMNLFARGIGGFCSDMNSASHGMRGRLWSQQLLLLAEGGLVCLFSTTHTLASAIVVMVIFSIFVQAAEGSTFAIVPYVDNGVTGSIAGVVAAGGSVGGVIFSLFFREYNDRAAFLMMGFLVMASSALTALISIPGHRSLLRGEDSLEVLERRDIHVERFGTLPNVELHLPNNETQGSRQAVIRSELPSTTMSAVMIPPNITEDPSTLSEELKPKASPQIEDLSD